MMVERRSRILRTIPVLIVLCVVSVSAQAKYSGGTGEPNDPYQIATAADLIALGETPEDYGKHFILTADIDLDPNLPGGKIFDKAVVSPTWATRFTGVFDGNDHTISHLTIKGERLLCLLGWLGSEGALRDLAVVDVNVTGSSYVGGLLAYNDGAVTHCYSTGVVSGGGRYVGGLMGNNRGAVTQCHSTGTVSGNEDVGGLVGSSYLASVTDCHSTSVVVGGGGVGGLVGENGGSVSRCYSTGAVTGGSLVGGVIGSNGEGGTVNECYSAGPVSGEGSVGGVVGFSRDADVTQCHSTGAVSGTGDEVGGLVGCSWHGHVTRCYSTGAVAGDESVGGLVGYSHSTVVQCYSTGAVNGTDRIGGLVGSNGGTVSNCYSTGVVRVPGADIGGLVGWKAGWVLTSVWDMETSSLVGSLGGWGGVGLTTVEMMDAYMLGLNGFANDPNWVLDAGRDYPRLAWEGTRGAVIPEPDVDWLEGRGTAEDPYHLEAADQLILLHRASALWDKHFVLDTDIDLDPNLPGGCVFTQAVVPEFAGILDGKGHSISHLTITGGSHLGVVGRLKSNAQVTDLNVVDVNVTGTGDYVGGLLGYNYAGTVTRCHSTGVVSGETSVGGLVGRNFGDMTDCSSTAVVSGTSEVGGLVGFHDGRAVTRCYSTGVVTGVSDVGGLVGVHDRGTVTRCYSTGAVSGSGHSVGGLAGSQNMGAVAECCYSTAAVSGGDFVGGLAGSSDGSVTRCYSTGPVDGNLYVGGLVGSSQGSVAQCYSAGAVNGKSYVGGLVGSDFGSTLTACLWDIQASGQATSAAGTGKTTTEMRKARTFLSWGTCGSEGAWTIDEDNDYPRLAWENRPGTVLGARLTDFLAGSGSEDDPYLIYTPYDIKTLANFSCEQYKHFRLMFLEGGGTQDNPYLIYTADEINLLNICPCEWDAYFRLMFVEGEGTQDSPYLISTAEQLNMIGMLQRELDKHYKLTADIDLGAYTGTTFNRIGNESSAFAGVLNGDGHAISNFSYTSAGTYNIGLFGYVWGPNSLIQNLRLTSPNIDAGTGGSVGALVGYLAGGTIANCHIDGGSVSGGQEVGGLVGTNGSGTITDCNSSATISGNGSVGSLVGRNTGAITHCDSHGHVLGDDNVGGLVGQNGFSYYGYWYLYYGYWQEPGTICDCRSTAAVLGTSGNCGGLVGMNYAGAIARCYASGMVLGVNAVGGLVGQNGAEMSNCYCTADVAGEKNAGGLVGYNVGAATNCYSTGIVLGDECVGGLVGDGDANGVVASLWDTQASGQSVSAGGTGKTTAEMQTAQTFLEAGWDFVDETANGTEDIWWILEGKDYPRLWWEAK